MDQQRAQVDVPRILPQPRMWTRYSHTSIISIIQYIRQRVFLLKDKLGWHIAKKYEKEGVRDQAVSPSSPNMYPIENMWRLWKRGLKKAFEESIFKGSVNVIDEAQILWKKLPLSWATAKT